MRRISRNLTVGTIAECRCEYCHLSTKRALRMVLPVVLTAGLWLVWRAIDERRQAKENGNGN